MIKHIQNKIKQLECEYKSILYTQNANKITLEDTDSKRIEECVYKIQVLNEIIMSYNSREKND
jgi:hypothetical protein